MAVRWSLEFVTALEHRDLQASAMAVDSTGTYVILAGRRYIAVKNLDDSDFESIRKFSRQSKYDVNAAEWNPTSHHSELCVISSNQHLEILTWSVGELTPTHLMRAHTRVITDLNWHRSNPNLLASSSIDTFIHVWDIRDFRKPALSLSAIAEASQVRWNQMASHILATAHDGDIKVWDQRKGNSPIQYITAHLSKIHGLHWNPQVETQIATSSQDNTVKFFDINNPRRAEFVLMTNSPVWRARYTPFGNGLITVVVPQLRRGENSLLLWNTDSRSSPVHTFVGHKDVVLEFEWRKQKAGENDFQLVTWSRDQTLLVWRIEPFLQKLCGYDPDNCRKSDSNENEVSDTASEVSFKTISKAKPLQQEFSLLNVQIPNLKVEKMDPVKRCCIVTASANNYKVILHVNFPQTYPNGIPPTFEIGSDSSIEDYLSKRIIQSLLYTAQQRVSKGRTCLEPCLRQFAAMLEQWVDSSSVTQLHQQPYLEPEFIGAFNDACIPFPRTSGAKFCSVSTLVCFGRQLHSRRVTTKVDSFTPRALSALGNANRRGNEQLTVISHYIHKQKLRLKQTNRSLKCVITVYDAAGLFSVNRQLAEKYILDGNVGRICKHNASMAESVGRWDLVQAWTLAGLITKTQQVDQDDMLQHPFGSQLIQSLISHYANNSDVQTAAMLSCVFGKGQEEKFRRKSFLKYFPMLPGGSPYHTIPPADVVADGWVFPLLRVARSNSLDNLKTEALPNLSFEKPPTSAFYEYYKLAYAEMLHRWGLLYNRAEILKYLCTPTETHRGVEFLTDCQKCKEPSRTTSCQTCKRVSLECIICHTSVRGSANCCLVCGHGGHTKHMKQWFEKYSVCATGCGCRCLIEALGIFNF
ncbi:hypothetical protein RI129_004890 [Pyrocoelia pectoralis]|uniref:RWD domain-containing protein n=1 Tax=Pyrocoelia pectoralis TaxID=417401 RepID=A0AAN7VK24_9COLE